MMKRMTAALTAMLTAAACLGSLAAGAVEHTNISTGEVALSFLETCCAINEDGIVGSILRGDDGTLIDDTLEADYIPNPGTIDPSGIFSHVLCAYPDAVYAVCIHMWPDEQLANAAWDAQEEIRTLDGRTYAEIRQDFYQLADEIGMAAAQQQPLGRQFMEINGDRSGYIRQYLNDIKAAEPERLRQAGITITGITQYTEIYALITAEELKNFPVSPEIGYKVFLAVAPGDVQADGSIDILDVITLQKSLMIGTPLNDSQILAADVDRSGTVDESDSLMILKKTVKLIDSFVED